jgi:uncharacterized protein involved in cysteine biosynthesis
MAVGSALAATLSSQHFLQHRIKKDGFRPPWWLPWVYRIGVFVLVVVLAFPFAFVVVDGLLHSIPAWLSWIGV